MSAGPKRRFQTRWLGLAGLVLAAAAAAKLASRRPPASEAFPREPGQFLPPERLLAEAARVEALVKEEPDNLKALVDLGSLRYQQGREHYIDGVNILEEARGLGATDVRQFYYLGAMYQELGLYPFAIAEYQRFLRHRPEDAQARLIVAKLEYHEGRFAEAAKSYEELHAEKPGDPVLRENLALSLMGAGRPQEARPLLEGLTSEGGDGARRAHFFLGKIAAANKEFNLAQSQFEKALEGGAPPPGVDAKELYLELAAGYEKLKQDEKARPAWEKVLALDPSNRDAKSHLRRRARAPRRRTRGEAARPRVASDT